MKKTKILMLALVFVFSQLAFFGMPMTAQAGTEYGLSDIYDESVSGGGLTLTDAVTTHVLVNDENFTFKAKVKNTGDSTRTINWVHAKINVSGEDTEICDLTSGDTITAGKEKTYSCTVSLDNEKFAEFFEKQDSWTYFGDNYPQIEEDQIPITFRMSVGGDKDKYTIVRPYDYSGYTPGSDDDSDDSDDDDADDSDTLVEFVDGTGSYVDGKITGVEVENKGNVKEKVDAIFYVNSDSISSCQQDAVEVAGGAKVTLDDCVHTLALNETAEIKIFKTGDRSSSLDRIFVKNKAKEKGDTPLSNEVVFLSPTKLNPGANKFEIKEKKANEIEKIEFKINFEDGVDDVVFCEVTSSYKTETGSYSYYKCHSDSLTQDEIDDINSNYKNLTQKAKANEGQTVVTARIFYKDGTEESYYKTIDLKEVSTDNPPAARQDLNMNISFVSGDQFKKGNVVLKAKVKNNNNYNYSMDEVVFEKKHNNSWASLTCDGRVQGAGVISAGGNEIYTCNWSNGNVVAEDLPIRFKIRLKSENDYQSSGASDYLIDILNETPPSKNKDAKNNSAAKADDNVSTSDVYLPSFIASLEENILLQTEDNGNIWVVDSEKLEKHFVPSADVALDVFRKISHGFSSDNLLKIEVDLDSVRPELDSDKDGYKDRTELANSYSPYDEKAVQFGIDKEFSELWKGKFLMRVDPSSDSDGDIWYVSKRNLKRYNFRTDNAMELFRNPEIHLGISNANLDKIPTAK